MAFCQLLLLSGSSPKNTRWMQPIREWGSVGQVAVAEVTGTGTGKSFKTARSASTAAGLASTSCTRLALFISHEWHSSSSKGAHESQSKGVTLEV